VDLRVPLFILQAHTFLHVLHPHHTITTLFLVSLNERESQGTAANGRCCTVIDVGTTSLPAELHPALATLIPTCTVYSDPPLRKLQLSRTGFRPHNLLFYNTNLSTSNPCNSTDFSLYVLTNSQHVSFTMLSKSSHVATVVASIGLTVGTLSLLRLQSYHQGNEGFECSLPQHTKLCQNRPAGFKQTWIELGSSNETSK
jgi:hypothetical protein